MRLVVWLSTSERHKEAGTALTVVSIVCCLRSLSLAASGSFYCNWATVGIECGPLSVGLSFMLDGFCWRVVVGAGVGSPSTMGDPVGALVGVTVGVLVGTLVSEFVCSFWWVLQWVGMLDGLLLA